MIGDELPVKLGPCGTDEYAPLPLDPVTREAIKRAMDECETTARRVGMPRRAFLRTASAVAITLSCLAACSKEKRSETGERSGGTFAVPDDAKSEPDVAEDLLGGTEFVFDVQGHLLDKTIDPAAEAEFGLAGNFPQSRCGEHDPDDCFSIEHFLEEIFVRSDTRMAVLSAVPVASEHDPLSPAVMREARRVAGVLCHDERVLLHGKLAPTEQPLDRVLADMERLVESTPIVGWKTYTHLVGRGWWLDDRERSAPQVGDAVIRKAVELGVPRIAVHKGLVRNRYNTPDDVGPAAKRHPDVTFLVYHSGYQHGHREGPYREGGDGIDALITSIRRAGIEPGGNVYAELGTSWWQMMRDPTQGAHAWGKLLKFLGEDNVAWGTDSIWYGSPQDQIEAFRALEISEELQERYGYPALTPQLKSKILGDNGARVYGVKVPTTNACSFDPADARAARASMSAPRMHGPRTRREFLALKSATR